MKKIKLFLIIILTISTLTGCWSKKELNELAIAVGLGIDKAKDGYIVSIQVVNPGELTKSRSGRSEVITWKMKGETVFEALRKLTTISPRKVYMAHLLQVVFGEEMAKDGIAKTLEFLARDHEIRPDFFIAIAKGETAYDTLRVQTSLEKLPSNTLYHTLENSEKNWAVTKSVKLDELYSSMVNKGKQPVLTGIKIQGENETGREFSNVEKISQDTMLRIGEIGVFKNDKLVGWLTAEESKGFNYITDNVKSSITTIPCREGKIAIETIQSKTNTIASMEKGKPKIDIFVTTEGNIGEVLCDIDLMEEKTIKNIEGKYKKNIKRVMKQVLRRVQTDFHSDIFGFGDNFHRSYPKVWRSLEPNWDQVLENVPVTLHVEAKIRRLGTITNSIETEM